MRRSLAAQIAPDAELWLKFEGTNPTGSFKDQGHDDGRFQGRRSGRARRYLRFDGQHFSAAAAAYCAVAGIRCVVLIPNNNIALGKLAQALIEGATVLAVEGNFDEALHIVRDLTESSSHRTAQFGQSPPHRGPENRGVRGLRFSGICARFPLHSRWATLATSPRIGRVTASITRRD